MQSMVYVSDTSFPSQPPATFFRGSIRHANGSPPFKIWLQDKRTQCQWECTIEDIDKYAVKPGAMGFPPDFVVSTLEAVLNRADTSGESKADMKIHSDGSATLCLNVVFYGKVSGKYEFPMKSSATESLEFTMARLNDVERVTRDCHDKIEQSQVEAKSMAAKVAALESKLTAVEGKLESFERLPKDQKFQRPPRDIMRRSRSRCSSSVSPYSPNSNDSLSYRPSRSPSRDNLRPRRRYSRR
ncbi:hypothetical protein Ae201684P_000154 [Aphanomyces euteiches]|uniref:Uncharacterized protein n=1 Tax=Aphanomyces euteiches TaxID=100861 RepID=A0A6G0XQX1_9STRA|nr:hypothetical protein Ae201684_002444 [Aphanomyces euteiches]KAH9086732.1 hypothetical protein Ae201684P_000154 [Aphanomyces euteiches]